MLADDLGNDIVPGCWLISCFGNYATMRFYNIIDYVEGGRLRVLEYRLSYASPLTCDGEIRLRAVRNQQTIQRPATCVVYQYEMLAHKLEGPDNG